MKQFLFLCFMDSSLFYFYLLLHCIQYLCGQSDCYLYVVPSMQVIVNQQYLIIWLQIPLINAGLYNCHFTLLFTWDHYNTQCPLKVMCNLSLLGHLLKYFLSISLCVTITHICNWLLTSRRFLEVVIFWSYGASIAES